MNPAFLDEMSWAMAEVYVSVTDRILVNLARHFPYIKPGQKLPGSFEYQARMLAQMGQVNKETVDIIAGSLAGADEALKGVLTAAITEALKGEEPKLRKAAEKGLLQGAGFIPPEASPNQMQAFRFYYRQSADRLNLVNTVMLESTQAAYTATVADIAAKTAATQNILNTAAGEVVTGVSTWNQAVRTSVQKMVSNGLTGFVDHGGHHWSPETYVAMDVRTTVFNTAREAVWERNEDYGNDLYQVSSHNGARPLCYPWQGKVISRTDYVREVEDLDGNPVTVIAQSETSYGEAAGLFGVNCRHYPMAFVPGFSTLKGEPQSPEENEKTYAESQEQRRLERQLREEKRDLDVMKAQGAPEDAIKAQRERVKAASQKVEDFCEETGRTRRRNREGAPMRAEWPTPGGSVTRYNGGYIGTDQVPPPKGPATNIPKPQNVAPQATTEQPVQRTIRGKTEKLMKSMSDADYNEAVEMIEKSPAAGLYERFGDSCAGITQKNGAGVYSRSADTVEYGLESRAGQSKYTTMAHEMGHMFDAKMDRWQGLTFTEVDTINDKVVIGSGMYKVVKVSPSSSDQFLAAMRADRETLRKLLNNPAEISIMKTGNLRNATAGIQDAMDGFFSTQDKGILPWGHGNKYYDRVYNKKIKAFGLDKELKETLKGLGFDVSNQTKVKVHMRDYDTASELWANALSAVTCGGEELDVFNRVMPNTINAILSILGGV